MKSFARYFLVAMVLLFLHTSCASRPVSDIRGNWEYTMTAADGNTYDTDVIYFSGSPNSGVYKQVNIYSVEYKGEFALNGNSIKLVGDEDWEGILADANTLSGKWSHADGVSGTFVAKRK